MSIEKKGERIIDKCSRVSRTHLSKEKEKKEKRGMKNGQVSYGRVEPTSLKKKEREK